MEFQPIGRARSLAKFDRPILPVWAEVQMKVVAVVDVQARADHGHEPRAGRVSHRVEEARVVDLVLLVSADRNPSVADPEAGNVDGIGEPMLTEPGACDAIDPTTVVGIDHTQAGQPLVENAQCCRLQILAYPSSDG